MSLNASKTDTRTILVIDDNKVVLTAMALLFKSKGYRVIQAETGSDAVAFLRREKIDLILLDIDFPPDVGNVCGGLRDGFLILDWARRMCDASQIPVFIVSSLDHAEYKTKAESRGISICFRKPVDRVQLLTAVQGVFEKTNLDPA